MLLRRCELDLDGCIFIYGLGEMVFEQINNSTGTVLYLHHDQQGSTRLLTGSTGKVEGKCSYSASLCDGPSLRRRYYPRCYHLGEMAKISVSLEDALFERVRHAAGSEGVSGWLAAAASARLRADALLAVAEEIAEQTGGPFSEQELNEARQWLPSSSTPAP